MKTLRAFFEIPAVISAAAMALVLVLTGCAGIPQKGIISPEFQLPVTKNLNLTECYYQYKGKQNSFAEERVPEASLPQAEVAQAKEKVRELVSLFGKEGYNVKLTTPPPNEVCKKVGGEDVEGAITMSMFLMFAPKSFLIFTSKTENTVYILVGLKSPQSGTLIAGLLIKRLEEKSMETVVAHFKRQLDMRQLAAAYGYTGVTAGTASKQ